MIKIMIIITTMMMIKKNYYFIHRGFCAISTKVQMSLTDLKIKEKVHLEQSAMIRKYFLREGMRFN